MQAGFTWFTKRTSPNGSCDISLTCISELASCQSMLNYILQCTRQRCEAYLSHQSGKPCVALQYFLSFSYPFQCTVLQYFCPSSKFSISLALHLAALPSFLLLLFNIHTTLHDASETRLHSSLKFTSRRLLVVKENQIAFNTRNMTAVQNALYYVTYCHISTSLLHNSYQFRP